MAQNDSDDVKLHATQTFAALGNKFSKLPRSKRLIIIGAVALLIYILGFVTCSVMNNVPTEGIIEKVAALPDAKNKCKFRYDRALEYAIMHECVFAKGTPGNGSKLVQRVNYCTCALEGVQMKKPYRRCSRTTSWTSRSRSAKRISATKRRTSRRWKPKATRAETTSFHYNISIPSP